MTTSHLRVVLDNHGPFSRSGPSATLVDMDSERHQARLRAFVPLDLLSSLRAPYGWTNKMRRAEGYPEIGDLQSRSARKGLWWNVRLALVVYGPWIAGAGIGFAINPAMQGAVFGLIGGVVVQLLGWMAWLVLVGLGRRRSTSSEP